MAKQIIKMPKSVKAMLALTPREKLPGLKAIFMNALTTEFYAKLNMRKSRDNSDKSVDK